MDWHGLLRQGLSCEPEVRRQLLTVCMMPFHQLLEVERAEKGWTVKEQAGHVGLDRVDFYKAQRRKLTAKAFSNKSSKQQRYNEYAKRVAYRFLTEIMQGSRKFPM